MPLKLVDCTVRISGRVILDGMSATFEPGQLVAIMGVSGAGKTTLLRLVGGEIQPEVGCMEGDQFSDFTAWIPQSAPVLPNRSVEDNVALGAFARGMSPARAYAIAQISLGEIGMRHYSFRRVRTLSGGERQRVAVARALAMGSPLILADEPTSSLDALNRDLVVSALRAVGARNGIVLIATHDEAVAAQCDHVIQLEDGKVQRAWSRNDVQ